MRVSTSKRIHDWIELSAVAEFFNKELEFDMAYEFAEIQQDWCGSVIELQQVAKMYSDRGESYEFAYNSADEFFPMIRNYILSLDEKQNDVKGVVLQFLRENTSLDEYNLEMVVESFLLNN